ncbi:MAG: hypothetical protein IKO10_18070 [Lachnospiraceae bacterium]|nr:hypothetical protein [Lachnospiraceae bacterium]
MWRKAENTIRPEAVEQGKSVVYIRKNITEEQREVDGETVTVYVYDEMKLPKELYPVFEQQQADIDYLTMLVEG